MNFDIVLFLLLAFRSMVPIALTAIGEVFAERAGVVNIGLEGILLASAFGSVVGGEFFLGLGAGAMSPWLGLLSGMFVGVVIGIVHGWIGIYLKGDQIISGVGINIFALGLMGFGLTALWNVKGLYKYADELRVPGFQIMDSGKFSYIIILTILLAILFYWILNRTSFGLRVKAVGENPEAADIAGVSVERTRMIAVIIGAALGGLAGAYLALDLNSQLTPAMSAGRGFIALATVVFSKLNPLLAVAGAFLFAASGALSTWAKVFLGPNYFYFIEMLPYVITLVAVAGVIGRARFPKATGVPYRRE